MGMSSGLAKEIGVSHVATGNFLKGQTPKSEHLFALSQYFGVTMESLLGCDDCPAPALKAAAPVLRDAPPGHAVDDALAELADLEEHVKLLRVKITKLKR